LIGHYVEKFYNEIPQAGWSSSQYVTESMHLARGGLGIEPKTFGGGLPSERPGEERIDYNNIFQPYKHETPTTWGSTTHNFHSSRSSALSKTNIMQDYFDEGEEEGGSKHKQQEHPFHNERFIRKYRSQWTTDVESENNKENEEGEDSVNHGNKQEKEEEAVKPSAARFLTEQLVGMNSGLADPRFKHHRLRLLRGRPLPVEKLRSLLREKEPLALPNANMPSGCLLPFRSFLARQAVRKPTTSPSVDTLFLPLSSLASVLSPFLATFADPEIAILLRFLRQSQEEVDERSNHAYPGFIALSTILKAFYSELPPSSPSLQEWEAKAHETILQSLVAYKTAYGVSEDQMTFIMLVDLKGGCDSLEEFETLLNAIIKNGH
jgi:hypothetical protein